MWKQWSIHLTKESVAERGLIRDGVHYPYNPHNSDRAKQLRKTMTKAEAKLWFGFLQKNSLKFYRQRPIDHFIVDFYCSKADLVIEIDGDTHCTDDAVAYDLMRTELLQLYGLRVIRFTNRQIFEEFASVCEEIERMLMWPPPTPSSKEG